QHQASCKASSLQMSYLCLMVRYYLQHLLAQHLQQRRVEKTDIQQTEAVFTSFLNFLRPGAAGATSFAPKQRTFGRGAASSRASNATSSSVVGGAYIVRQARQGEQGEVGSSVMTSLLEYAQQHDEMETVALLAHTQEASPVLEQIQSFLLEPAKNRLQIL
ncbi:unnamed protein product, partial [Amoebophrya sp. A25]